MNGFVYLDNSATTKPCDSAVKAAVDAMTLYWGNPSSLYDMGAQAEYKMSEARDSVAAALSCRSDEVFSPPAERKPTTLLYAAQQML